MFSISLVCLFLVEICCATVSLPRASPNRISTREDLSSTLARLGHNIPHQNLVRRNLTSVGSVSTISCNASCNALNAVLPGKVSFPGSTNYEYQQSEYWSAQQEAISPACRVQPTAATDVGSTLIVSEFYACPFAVKSGGHGSFAGTSNIEGGIAIDLSQLNNITLSANKTLAQIGTGNRWIDVYNDLVPQNMTVIGGRVSPIGVGGLTLGGGISFFSQAHGFACDNVRNYEVVLSDGQILDVNYTSYPDLYWALRGGGNNLGIVTRFDMETIQQGQMWGGQVYYPFSANASLFKAFENFAVNVANDTNGALILALGYAFTEPIIASSYEYAKPIVDPPLFQEFTAVESISSTTRITTLTDLVAEQNASNFPNGYRELYRVVTCKSSAKLQSAILDIFVEEGGPLNSTGVAAFMDFQPISKSFIGNSMKNGGNALGLEVNDGPLMLVHISAAWFSADADTAITSAIIRILDRTVETATSMGLEHRYIYQNYAYSDQDVFSSYGEANRERLLNISRLYDPERVFQNYEPGYFKLGD